MNLYKNDLPDNVKITGSVAIDTESMGLVIKRDRLCLIQMCTDDQQVHMVQLQKHDSEHPRKAENLKKILTDKTILKIFHFARFDVSALNHTFGINVSPIYCTKVASKLCRTFTDRHSLKSLCKDLLNIDISKHEQTSDWGRETLSDEQLKYAAGDVLYLHTLKSKLDEIIKRENKTRLAQKCFETLESICELDLHDISPELLFQH